MPHYVHNVVYYQDGAATVLWHMEPEAFAGSPEEFARTTLLAWLTDNEEHAQLFVTVNVWDSDRPGPGIPANILAQLSSDDLDEGPFDPEQLYADYGQYRIVVIGADPIRVDLTTRDSEADDMPSSVDDLIAVDEWPGLQVRTGHTGWITLRVALSDSEPSDDLTQWDGVEQVVIGVPGEVRIADFTGEVEEHYPDLTQGHHVGHLAIRVSVRGRTSPEPVATATHPRRTPLEEHRVEAWPVAHPAPRVILKRDDLRRGGL